MEAASRSNSPSIPIPYKNGVNPYLVCQRNFKKADWKDFQLWLHWLFPEGLKSQSKPVEKEDVKGKKVIQYQRAVVSPGNILMNREAMTYFAAVKLFDLKMQEAPGNIGMLLGLHRGIEKALMVEVTKFEHLKRVVVCRNTTKNKETLIALKAEAVKMRDFAVRSLMMSRDAQVTGYVTIELIVINFTETDDPWEKLKLRILQEFFQRTVLEIEASAIYTHSLICFFDRGIRILTNLIQTQDFVDVRSKDKV